MISSKFYVFDTESIDFGAFHCLDRPVCRCVVITAEALKSLPSPALKLLMHLEAPWDRRQTVRSPVLA